MEYLHAHLGIPPASWPCMLNKKLPFAKLISSSFNDCDEMQRRMRNHTRRKDWSWSVARKAESLVSNKRSWTYKGHMSSLWSILIPYRNHRLAKLQPKCTRSYAVSSAWVWRWWCEWKSCHGGPLHEMVGFEILLPTKTKELRTTSIQLLKLNWHLILKKKLL